MKLMVASQRLESPEKMKQLKKRQTDCDLYIDLGAYVPGWMSIRSGGNFIFHVAGHGVFVSFGYQVSCHVLAALAKEAGCDLLLWGQNANAWIVEIEGVLFVSPGCVDHASCSLPPSYARIDLQPGLFPKAELCFRGLYL